jgi:aspartokinase/homoserine dehydrogenase 1
VVFSAFSGVTDQLLVLARRAAEGDNLYRELFNALRRRHVDTAAALLEGEHLDAVLRRFDDHFDALNDVLHGIFLIRETTPRTLDLVLSFGERNSAYLLAHVMQQAGIPADYLDARSVIRTDDQFGSAHVDFTETNRLVQAHFTGKNTVQSVTGFIGSTVDGLTTTLGRGGSDYTAAILGAALNAALIEIWTDVDGVLTADPRRVKKAFTLTSMSYREAMEMSHFGAKVIYPPTILPALAQNIPLRIRNTFNPTFPGTLISNQPAPGHDGPVTGISSINQVCLLTLQGSGLFGVPGIAARLFGALARAKVNVVLITQGSSESSITFAVSPAQAQSARLAAEKEFAFERREGLVEPLRVEENLSVVAVVGETMRYRPGIAGKLFQALGKNGVNVVAIAQGSSELNISVVVPASDETKALNAIHEAFFLSDVHTLHVYLVGVGLIGSTLLEQIKQQTAYLRNQRRLEIRVVGLANSRRMVFDTAGIDLDQWRTLLDAGEPFSMARFTEYMKTYNLSNALFVDNTASADVAAHYASILDASIAISTPNKIAASSGYDVYQKLKALAAKRNVTWKYETNVGAGLPIITTLNDLLLSGDRILAIEGVLSGTLSYIFNQFGSNPATKFSALVREAKALGLTEPDPREDLSGADVRRKLLILAREAGLPLEINDIQVDQLLPHACLAVHTVEEFFEQLEKHEADFETMRARAASDGKVLRFVAALRGNTASLGLQAYGPEHPFYFLSGSDNMVVFTTERYRERPLVVRGPGAGAEVTAAGVFAEIVASSHA